MAHQHYLPSIRAWISASGAFDAISLLVLADLELATKRTLMLGNATYLDALAIIPGMHHQLTAPDMSKGEYPACAAMTTGYVFRVENSATVHYLQSVGRTGQLTLLKVGGLADSGTELFNKSAGGRFYIVAVGATLSLIAYLLGARDWIGLTSVGIILIARLLLAFTIRRRAKPGWFGALEPGVQSDLLVLLSQDRWVRIQGPTDDVKAITSGTWLSEPTALETSLGGLSKYLIYLGVAVFTAADPESKWAFFLATCISALSAHVANLTSNTFTMHGRELRMHSSRVKYNRRLDMVKELVATFNRADCFVGMGMIQPHEAEDLLKQASAQRCPDSGNGASYDKQVVM